MVDIKIAGLKGLYDIRTGDYRLSHPSEIGLLSKTWKKCQCVTIVDLGPQFRIHLEVLELLCECFDRRWWCIGEIALSQSQLFKFRFSALENLPHIVSDRGEPS